MCNLSGKYSDRNKAFDSRYWLSYKKHDWYPGRGGERNPEKEKCMWRFQPRCLEFSTPPLSRDCRPHVQPFCLHVFFSSAFSLSVGCMPSEVSFQFARGKSPVFESVRGREARIDRCAVKGGLSKVVVLEVRDTLGGRTPRQQEKSSTLCHRDKDVEL